MTIIARISIICMMSISLAGCLFFMYRHPETSQRPSFRDIVLTLVGSEEVVLNIPEEDSSTDPLAGVLGAPLEAGEGMYSELFKRYLDADD